MTDPTADRALPLLWRGSGAEGAAPRRGPRPKVSIDDVVDAGIEVADAAGLDTLSMRGLAQRLGIGAMTVYTYVPGRDELIVLMTDQVLGRTERPAHPDDTRRRLEAVAEAAYAEYSAHPWLLEVAGLRAWLGPHAADRYEWQLTAVEGLGLDDLEMDRTVALLDGCASSAVRARQEVRLAERSSGLTELQWWEANYELLGELMAGRSYPLAGRVGTAAGEAYQAASDPEGQFRFSLDRIVDGLLVLLDR
ncbi:TetR family transcriptional regulator [Nocardioides sp. zg-1308]|uniref:TetR/AcrR family transcriptional regulator n=1 Tax=Nocardioides sp. zg-1308 TaxID=2736253 RepID=UPI001557B83B|nr:TetR family transcriptional regulator [Nocardioides sp. zg-1308]